MLWVNLEVPADEGGLRKLIKKEISRRIREDMKEIIEQLLEEEMTGHLATGYRERTSTRRGKPNSQYTRSLVTRVDKIKQLHVPRNGERTFLTEDFERQRRITGEVEEAVLKMYSQGDLRPLDHSRHRGALSYSHQQGLGFPDRSAFGRETLRLA